MYLSPMNWAQRSIHLGLIAAYLSPQTAFPGPNACDKKFNSRPVAPTRHNIKSRRWLRKRLATGFELFRGLDGLEDLIVARGGSYSSPANKQSGTMRDWFAPTTKDRVLGFRLVRTK